MAILIKAGNLDEAIALIEKETGGAISELKLAERYHNLLSLRQVFPKMLEHGRPYLDLLAKAKQTEKMCEVYLECKARDTAFAPAPATHYSVARELSNLGKPEEAVTAFDDFTKANGDSPLLQNAYFLMAKIYREKMNNTQKAAEILQYLISAFPFHENTAMVTQYLRQIKA